MEEAQNRLAWLVLHKRFDAALLTLIVANTICLALDDPTDSDSPRSQFVDAAEIVFQVLFTIELALKLLGLGLKGYIQSGWNCVDGAIVCVGWVELALGNTPGVSSLRVFRALRPLRSVNRLPELRVIVNTLLVSIPQLSHVMLLSALMYCIIGLAALQVWLGQTHYCCYADYTGSISMEEESPVLCSPMSDAVSACPSQHSCHYYIDTPQNGIFSFDNFGTTLMLAFLTCTVESWTNLLTELEATVEWSEYWLVVCWFVVCVIVGGGLILNLAPAVLKASFSDMNQNAQKKKPPPETSLPYDSILESGSPLSGNPLTQGPSMDSPTAGKDHQAQSPQSGELIPVVSKDHQPQMPTSGKLSPIVSREKQIGSPQAENQAWVALMEQTMMDAGLPTEAKNHEKVDCGPTPVDSKLGPAEAEADEGPSMLVALVEHPMFDGVFFVLILLNIVVLVVDSNDLGSANDVLGSVNFVFTLLFTMEVGLKIFALGELFWRETMNVLDFVIVVISLVEYLVWSTTVAAGARILRVVRLVRLVKVLKLAHSMTSLQLVLSVLESMGPTMVYILIMLLLAAVVFSIMGMGLFGGGLSVEGTGVPDANFDSFPRAMLSTFQLITLEDWPVMFSNLKYSRGGWWSIFFVLAVIILGNFILLNLMLAIMLNFFESTSSAVGALNTSTAMPVSTIYPEEGAPEDTLEQASDRDMEDEAENQVDEEEPSQRGCWDKLALQTEPQGCAGWMHVYHKPEIPCCPWFRAACAALVVSPTWNRVVTAAIITNCILLAVDPTLSNAVLNSVDIFFTVGFAVEIVIKLSALGMRRFFKTTANRLDVVVVSLSLMELSVQGMSAVKAVRAVRVLRPLRLILRSEGMMLVSKSLVEATPAMTNVLMVCSLGWIVFGVIFVELYKDQPAAYCSCYEYSTEAACVAASTTNKFSHVVGCSWRQTNAKFNNTFAAWLSLFQLASLEGWTDVMYHYYLAPDGNFGDAVLFVLWIALSNWLLLNLWVGVIYLNYQACEEKHNGTLQLNERKREWKITQRSAFALKPHLHVLRPYKRFWIRRRLFDIVTHTDFEFCVYLAVILNTVLVASSHFQKSESEMWDWELWVTRLDVVFALAFFLEMLTKVSAFTWKGYWRPWWNRVDFVLSLYLIPDLVTLGLRESGNDQVDLLQLLRVAAVCRSIRLVRLFSLNNGVMTILYTLLVTLPSVMHIGLMLVLVLYMYSICGVILFGDLAQDGDALTSTRNFETTPAAVWALFQICTGDVWPDVMNACMHSDGGSDAAAFFFVTLIMLVSFLLLSMFITVLVDQFLNARRIFSGIVRHHHLEEFQDLWSFYDREGTGIVAPHNLMQLLLRLPAPLGVPFRNSNPSLGERKAEVIRFITLLEPLPDRGGQTCFNEVLAVLCDAAYGFIAKDPALAKMVAPYRHDWEAKNAELLERLPANSMNFSVGDRLAAMVMIRIVHRRIYIKTLSRGEMPKSIAAGINTTDTARACQTLLRIAEHTHPGEPALRERNSLPLVPEKTQHSWFRGAIPSDKLARTTSWFAVDLEDEDHT